MSTRIVNEVTEKDFRFAGVRFFRVRVKLYEGAPGYRCGAMDLPYVLENYHKSSSSSLDHFGQSHCCGGAYRTTDGCAIEIDLESGSSNSTHVVCDKWLQLNLPHLHEKLFPPPDPLEPAYKIDFRRPPENSFPVNAYGLPCGVGSVEDAMKHLCEAIGRDYAGVIAKDRKIPVQEAIRHVQTAQARLLTIEHVKPEFESRGDGIQWWIRKGYSEPPMPHEM